MPRLSNTNHNKIPNPVFERLALVFDNLGIRINYISSEVTHCCFNMERSLQPTFSLDSGTRQETLLCLSRNSWNCCSLMTNLSASLRASSPAFSPSISRHWNTWSTFRGGECLCVSRRPQCKRTAHSLSEVTFQRTGPSWVMLSVISSSTLKVLMTELSLNATLYCWHQSRIL